MNRKSLRVVSFLLLLCLSGCAEPPLSPIAEGEYVDDFIVCWECFDSLYCDFPHKQIDWQECYSRYLPAAAQADNDMEFIGVLMDLLGELHDGHVYLFADDHIYVPYALEFDPNYDMSVIYDYFELEGGITWNDEGQFGYCVFPEMSYLMIPSWSGGVFDPAVFHQVFDSLFTESEVVVIDERMNYGGSTTNANHVAGRFTDEDVLALYFQYRNGPDHGDYTELYPFCIAPLGSWHFAGDVYVLQGRTCASSSEWFLNLMGVLPNVVTVGERSYGAGGIPQLIALPNGWQINVPYIIVYTSEMIPVEWNGIEPDVHVPTTPEDFAEGRDPVLDYVFSECGLRNWGTQY